MISDLRCHHIAHVLYTFVKYNLNQFDTICTCCKADGRSWLEKYGCKVEFQAVKRLGGEASDSNTF